MRYNPNYHQNVIKNLKDEFKRKHPKVEIKVPDEVIWNIWTSTIGSSYHEELEWFIETLFERNTDCQNDSSAKTADSQE